ncbi:MAG TPA: methyl-accepting chemotaxis protein [Isosphaeraceae bacterium]|jgi:methyl-accepting chemotaxis protein WspA|nr:methyl-accepting chemotaxis protein [Isosphaeraceae bacterium]
MPLFRDATIKAKLYGLVVFSTLCLVAVLCVSFWVLFEYRINGPIYRLIIRRATALSDVEPATFDVMEPYLILLEVASTNDPAEVRRLTERFAQYENRFQEKKAYWLELLYEGPLKEGLTKEVWPLALDFFQAAKADFLEPIARGEAQRATESLKERIRPKFQTTREAVERTVQAAKRKTAIQEAEVTAGLRFWLTTMIVVSILSLVVSVSAGGLVTREIVRPTNLILKRVDEMASGASDLTARVEVQSRDEVGKLATGINAMMGKIQTIVRRVRETSVALLSTAAQMGSTAREQEATMHGLGSSTTEIAAAVREISATSKELAGAMAEVNQRANQAAALATSGRSQLAAMETNMKQLVDSTDSISSKLAIIREKAENINVVVTTITKVADQTNLLSINAAIEAEKAGEYGRGFLVVAREIRRLADQTAVATLDIENIVRHMQDAVSAGVMQMDKFSGEVRGGVQSVAEISHQTSQIIEEVQALSDRFQVVNEGMRNQSLGAEQINEAMGQVAAGTQQTQATLQEFNNATAHLRQSVEVLNQEIAQFTV